MSAGEERDARPGDQGAMTAPGGTALAVDISADRPARLIWVAFLGGPVILMTHFMVVYLVAEAACSGEGRGLDAFDSPVVEVVTVTATVVAAIACLVVTWWNHRRWRTSIESTDTAAAGWPFGDVDDSDGGGSVAFAGALLAAFCCLAVIAVGIAAPFLPSC